MNNTNNTNNTTTSFIVHTYMQNDWIYSSDEVREILTLKEGKTAIFYDRIQREIPRWFMSYWGEINLPEDPYKTRVERHECGCTYKFKTSRHGEPVEVHLEFYWEDGKVFPSGRIYYLNDKNDWGDPVEHLEYLIPILD